MEAKKISFGFTKVTQKPNLAPKTNTKNNKIELIDCLEGQTIKIKYAVEEVKTPLIIPIRDNSKNLLDRVKETRRVRTEAVSVKPDSELTLDELAAKQLIEEARAGYEIKKDTKVLKLPTIPDAPAIEGKEESSLADYENIPIEDYGLAMLRGMGWTEGSGIGKNQKVTKPIEPELRPKGMGLGAKKMVSAEEKPPPVDKDGKQLVLVKGAYAKIIAGVHRGNYCEVLGLDDESGRIIVKTTIKNVILSLNEFLVQVVTKEEYANSSKVINNAKYEEYKEKSKIKSETFNSTNDNSDLDAKHSKQNPKSKKSSAEHRSKSHKIKSEGKTETQRSRRRSRSRSYDYKSRSRKHRDSSYSSETDDSESSIEPRSKRESDSSDYDYDRSSKNSERERKREDRSRKKKSKKQKRTATSSHDRKKSKNKSKKKYQDTTSDSDESDQAFRKHRHSNHKDSHRSSRR